MTPATLNYIQSNQQTGGEQQAPYNPFDSGIQKAIASARMSLGMTREQQESALRGSMLTFADNIAQQPKQKGLFANFASAGRALSPAIRAHDEAENTAFTQNNALANQILAHQAAEQQRQAQGEERAWHRQHAENQLGEQRRYHDMMNSRINERDQSIGPQKSRHSNSSSGELTDILNNAEKLLTEDLEKQETYRGRTSNLLSRFTPGGYIPSKQQAQVNALGDVLRGKLFNTWGYRNRAEFEHVPSISADNPPEVNLEIIKTLKNLLGDNAQMENEQLQGQLDPDQGMTPQDAANISSVLMQDSNGNQYMIPASEVEGALNDGLIPIEGQ